MPLFAFSESRAATIKCLHPHSYPPKLGSFPPPQPIPPVRCHSQGNAATCQSSVWRICLQDTPTNLERITGNVNIFSQGKKVVNREIWKCKLIQGISALFMYHSRLQCKSFLKRPPRQLPPHFLR